MFQNIKLFSKINVKCTSHLGFMINFKVPLIKKFFNNPNVNVLLKYLAGEKLFKLILKIFLE